jgi:hypothetical protein
VLALELGDLHGILLGESDVEGVPRRWERAAVKANLACGEVADPGERRHPSG